MAAARKWIVVAWPDESWEIDPGAPMARRDLGERPKMRTVQIAKAASWIRSGDRADEQKAKAFIEREHPGGRVFAYPLDESDPLGRARREMLKPKRARRR